MSKYDVLRDMGVEIEQALMPTNKAVCSSCPHDSWNKEQGCCRGCERHSGYFTNYDYRGIDIVVRELKRLYGWSTRRGFFDNTKKCCKLPRHLRSATCLYYGTEFNRGCTYFYKHMGGEVSRNVRKLISKMLRMRLDL